MRSWAWIPWPHPRHPRQSNTDQTPRFWGLAISLHRVCGGSPHPELDLAVAGRGADGVADDAVVRDDESVLAAGGGASRVRPVHDERAEVRLRVGRAVAALHRELRATSAGGEVNTVGNRSKEERTLA